MSYFRNQLEEYLKKLEIKADRVLDIGGGSNPVKNRVRKWDVKEYKIMDNKLEAPQVDIDYDVDMNRAVGLYYDSADIFEKFDIVFCLEVFEYIFRPFQALENIYNLLRRGGITYISFPLLYPIHEPRGHDYLRYTEEGIEKMLKETGFKILETEVRMAHPNSQYFLNEFYKIEGMHFRHGDLTRFHTGYIIKAKK